MNTEHRQQKISFWHSMKTQFIAVVILVAAVIVILYTLMIMPGVKSNIRSIYSNYLLDLSISYGREVESAMQVNADFLDNPEAAQDILQQLDVAGAKTAYAYLVGFDGTMLSKRFSTRYRGEVSQNRRLCSMYFRGKKNFPHVIPAKNSLSW